MGLLDIFRRWTPISTEREFADFLDSQAAFVAQKGIYEYSRARAGHFAKLLMKDPVFLAAADASRWRAYPLTLAMVAEVADNVLHSGVADRQARLPWLKATTLAVFDRYPAPASLEPGKWQELRADLDRRLTQMSLHPPKRAMDIPDPYAQLYFDTLPIHEKLRASEFHTTHSYLKVTLCNVHDELDKRLNRDTFARAAA